jgi:lysyl-tRNA synthetase class 2
MLEAYRSYADYRSMLTLARQLIQHVACAVYGAEVARRADGEFDISGCWPVITVHDAVSTALGTAIDPDTPPTELRAACNRAGVPVDPDWTPGRQVQAAYEKLVEPATERPVFYIDFPVDVSPLTRQHREDSRLAERWDLVAFGAEIGTAYSELTDPTEQRHRLQAQSLLAAGGDSEAMELDEDFLRALEHGMPPTGGLGIGLDRLLMMLTGAPIRQTVLFPFARSIQA